MIDDVLEAAAKAGADALAAAAMTDLWGGTIASISRLFAYRNPRSEQLALSHLEQLHGYLKGVDFKNEDKYWVAWQGRIEGLLAELGEADRQDVLGQLERISEKLTGRGRNRGCMDNFAPGSMHGGVVANVINLLVVDDKFLHTHCD